RHHGGRPPPEDRLGGSPRYQSVCHAIPRPLALLSQANHAALGLNKSGPMVPGLRPAVNNTSSGAENRRFRHTCAAGISRRRRERTELPALEAAADTRAGITSRGEYWPGRSAPDRRVFASGSYSRLAHFPNSLRISSKVGFLPK